MEANKTGVEMEKFVRGDGVENKWIYAAVIVGVLLLGFALFGAQKPQAAFGNSFGAGAQQQYAGSGGQQPAGQPGGIALPSGAVGSCGGR